MFKVHRGTPITLLWSGLSLAKRFTLISLLTVVGSGLGIGAWVSRRIESSVFRLVTVTTTLYVDTIIEPNLQELAYQKSITPTFIKKLQSLLQTTPFGRDVIAFKVWDATGRIVYSVNPDNIGRSFPGNQEVARAFAGEAVAGFSALEDDENYAEREKFSSLLQLYIPVHDTNNNRVIAVAEFYKLPDAIRDEIISDQQKGWLVVSLPMLTAFVLLIGFVRNADTTISKQQNQLTKQVQSLEDLLAQNSDLRRRVHHAAESATELNEKTLWRVGSDLHDGPAQDLSLALIRLDHVLAYFEDDARANSEGLQVYVDDVYGIRNTLQHALNNIRTIAHMLVLPNIENLDLHNALIHVSRTHELNTRTHVELVAGQLPSRVSTAVKIALCRILREALINSYRHGHGQGQQVDVSCDGCFLKMEIFDHGPGFDEAQMSEASGHLGLTGMRYRAELLGGRLQITSQIGHGTTVIAQLPLNSSSDVL